MDHDYIVATASTCDLTKEYLAEHNIPFIKYSYSMDEKVYYDDCSEDTRKDVYKKMRNGTLLNTAAINTYAYKEFFEEIIKERGEKNIVFLDMAKAMSASHKFAEEAIEELKEKFPKLEIVYVDTCCVSGGLGLLVMNVVRNYEAGLGYKEMLQWIEDNKFKIAHRFTVDDLSYLKRGGRVSNSAALVGTLLNIKPVLYVPNEGTLLVSSKVRGRKKALNTIIDSIKSEIGNPDGKEFLINHADCDEDAEYVRDKLKDAYPSIGEIHIQGLGVVIGAHCGPGLLAIFYMTSQRNP
ncbi:MAG: DegV family protein [Lachnospiraceae bacterium]|nr:DegV family protein [Lachnospiraceae bacterium]